MPILFTVQAPANFGVITILKNGMKDTRGGLQQVDTPCLFIEEVLFGAGLYVNYT